MKKIALLMVLVLLFSSCKIVEKVAEKILEEEVETTKEKKEKEEKNTEKEETTTKKEKKSDSNNSNPIKYEDAHNKEVFEGFSDSQIDILNEKGYIVLEQNYDEYPTASYHSIYEMANYADTPSFITTDAALNAFSIFYSDSMKSFELQFFYNNMSEISLILTENLLEKYNSLKTKGDLKDSLKSSVAYMFVASKLFLDEQEEINVADIYTDLGHEVARKYMSNVNEYNDLKSRIPREIMDIVDEEYERVMASADVTQSDLFGYTIDYSQFKPRGHYTSAAVLERFFRGQMWLSNPGFELEENTKTISIAFIIANEIFENSEVRELWHQVYKLSRSFSSSSDDITFEQLEDALDVLGSDGISALEDKETFSKIEKEVKKLPEPKVLVQTSEQSDFDLSTKKQFRVMGQRYSLDQYIMSHLMRATVKPYSSSFEVFAVMGNEICEDLFYEYFEPDENWSEYPEELEKMKEEYKDKKEELYMDDLYHGYIKAIDKSLNMEIDESNENIPYFMKLDDYKYKEINTALGAFAQLKHANVLYSKQSMAEMGAPEETGVLHYVEPNVELYEELYSLCNDTRDVLIDNGINESDIEQLGYLTDAMKLLAEVSALELDGEDIPSDMNSELGFFGGVCESIKNYYIWSVNNYGFEIDYADTSSQPVISDISTIVDSNGSRYLELGIGVPLEIYVLVNQNGKDIIARGLLYSSYEFYYDERLTDETWQEMIGVSRAEYGGVGIDKYVEDAKLVSNMPYASKFVTDEKNNIIDKYVEIDW